MAAEWYYRVMGDVHGPFTASQFRQLAGEGVVSPMSDVRKGAKGIWVSAQRIEGLFPAEEQIDWEPSASNTNVRDSEFAEVVESFLEVDQKDSSSHVGASIGMDIADAEVLAFPAVPALNTPATIVKIETPRFAYKMVQIPQVIEVDRSASTRGRAAAYLQDVVDEFASEGWEFYRVDTIGVYRNAGCLGQFMGATGETYNYYVVTFRRPA